jgi:hypothetical protein
MESRMKKNPERNLFSLFPATLAVALSLTSGALFSGPGTQTEDDVYVGKKRQVEGVTTPATGKPAKPGAATTPNTARSAVAPTATTKTPLSGGTAPVASLPAPKPGSGVSPNTAALVKKTNARAGGDDDLKDLEVERRKLTIQGGSGPTGPLLRPGTGPAPNTGRSASPTPTPGQPLPK